MKYTELEKKLKAAKCYELDTSGKHPTWYSPITKKRFQTSHHKKEEVKPGTLRSILRDAGIK